MPKVNIICHYCKDTVTRKLKPSRKDAGLYCSRECAFKMAGVLKAERKALKNIAKNIRKLNKIKAIKDNRDSKRNVYVTEAIQCQCKRCGIYFEQATHLGRKRKYCLNCLTMVLEEAYRKQNRISKSQRRARIKNTKIENIDPLLVFENYGWHCYICGIATPKDKRGTYEPNAPELDHIMPLAKGGTHTKENLACCCRACNHKKSDSIPMGGVGVQRVSPS